MFTEFQHEYEKLRDEELLQLASARQSLTEEAKYALDAEMRNRNLTPSDLAKHENFVNKSDRREKRRRSRKLFGSRRTRLDWVETAVTLFWTAVAIALISMGYLSLPARYRFSHDWQEAVTYVMFCSVFLIVAGSDWWRKIWFWMSLLISSTAHALIVHGWIFQAGTLNGSGHRAEGRLATLLGVVLFLVVCGCGFLLSQKFYGDESRY